MSDNTTRKNSKLEVSAEKNHSASNQASNHSVNVASNLNHNSSKFNNKILVITSFSVLLAVIITGGVALALKNKTSSNPVKVSNSQENKVVQNNYQPETKSETVIKPLKAEEKTDSQAALLDFIKNPFDPETEKPSDRFITFKIRQGQKYRMTVDYSNIGDAKMEKGSLTIKLGSGLSLVKNSIKEDISGKETTNVDDTNLYSAETNTIKYGPGSLNKVSSVVNPNESGKITFDVEMSINANVGDTSRIYSYLSDDGENKGKIDLVFFTVTAKQ